MLQSSQAIILNVRKFGDTSKIVSLYSQEDGLISVIAKGSRLPKNKFGSSIEPLSHSNVTYYKKSERDLYLLSQSELIENYRKIFDSSEKLTMALAIVESIALTQHQHEPNAFIFEQLVVALSSLNQSKENEYNYFVKFQIELAGMSGFNFDFTRARYCTPDERIYLAVESGDFVVNIQGRDCFSLTGNQALYLQSIDNSGFDKLNEIDIDKNNIKVINTMLSRYYSYHLDKYFHYKTFDTYLAAN